MSTYALSHYAKAACQPTLSHAYQQLFIWAAGLLEARDGGNMVDSLHFRMHEL